MQSFIRSNSINDNANILIQVFTGVVKTEFIEKIIAELSYILPQAEIIGTTTAGEIYKEKVLTNTTIISFTVFEKTKVKSKLLNNNDTEYNLGINIVEKLVEEDTKVIILFSSGISTNNCDIINGIQSTNRNVVVCGGKAADNGYLKETFVFTKEGITKNGAAAISLAGKQLNITTECSFGWSTIGKLMTITKAVGNRIYAIDNVNVVDIYKKYLGDQVAEGLPMSATEFPLMVNENGINMAKVAYIRNDDGSLSYLSNVKVNDKVQFGYGNVNTLIDYALEIANYLEKRNVEAIFVYSCSVRRSFMQDKASLEIVPLNNIAPTFGFFTYGEFFTFNNSIKQLNATMTILGLSEGEQDSHNNKLISTKKESSSNSFFDDKDFGVIKVFTNLVNQATKELQEANEILADQKYKIEQMNKITKSILQINTEMISSGEINKFLQIILDKVFDIITKGKMGCILLLENNNFCYKATKGYFLDKIKDISYSFENIYQYDINCIDDIFKPLIITNPENYLFHEAYGYNLLKEILCETPRELLTCGIGIDGQIVGFINIFNTDMEEDFNEEDKSLLKYLCYDIAIALKNLKLLENTLHLSRYDSLTGLYNRHYFREILDKTLNIARLSDVTFVLCVLDLNNLKIINDTYGHDAGDELLEKLANVLKTEIGKQAIFGRTGGDEFIGIFINKNKDQVTEIMSEVYMTLKNYTLYFNEDKKEISFAYGLSEFLKDSDDVEKLLKIADKRMYENKKLMKENDKYIRYR